MKILQFLLQTQIKTDKGNFHVFISMTPYNIVLLNSVNHQCLVQIIFFQNIFTQVKLMFHSLFCIPIGQL